MPRKNMTEAQRLIIEDQGWSIHECTFTEDKRGFELEKYSPAGEDFFFAVEAETPEELVENIRVFYDSFDADEHAAMWIEHRGEGGCPSSVRLLIDDADAIDNMLRDLAAALEGL